MKIEQEIQTEKFYSEHQKATINITFTSGWLTAILADRASKYDITLQQFNVLRILRGQYPKPSTNNLIKERMIDRMPDISRIIDRLVAKELVSRCKNDEDRRTVDVMITEKGIEILDKLQEQMMLSDILPANISAEECHQLNVLLDKLRTPKTTQ